MWPCSKGSKEQKRGRMSLVQTLQMPTEKNQEEDREGIVQLRIYRVQASVALREKMIKCALHTTYGIGLLVKRHIPNYLL
jgi:hypothetical protein